jgi:hypothetical protein
MAKDPFRESAKERAIRLASKPLFHTAAEQMAGLDTSFGTRAIAEEMRRYELARGKTLRDLIDPPTLQLARESAEQFGRADEQRRAALAPFGQTIASLHEQMSVSTRARQESMGRGTSSWAAAFQQQQRQIEEATRPFAGLLEELGHQQIAVAKAFGSVRPEQWEQLTKTAEALRRSFVLQAEVGNLNVAGTEVAMAMATALEAVEPDQQPDPAVAVLLLNIVGSLLHSLLKNTNKHARSLSLIDLLLVVLAFKGAWPDDAPREVQQLFERIEQQATTAAIAESEQEAYVLALPRAVVVGAGRVRRGPAVDAPIATKLSRETVVGVEERSDKWRRVIYRDPLSGALQQGWIYHSSLEDLQR